MSLMLDFYGLLEHPFGVSPDPRFLYSSLQHREALEQLVLGIDEHDGLAALIGEAGSGKTTILLELLQRYRQQADLALVFNTQCSGAALLSLIATGLHIPGADSEHDALRLHQLIASFVCAPERTKPVVIIIDEAQNLDSSALETIRLLSNIESSGHKFLHIILAGQPRLETNLRTANRGQLLQRITTISRISPLSAAQVQEYIYCRLRAAGYAGPPLFATDALSKIANQSGGIPREINRICNNALKLAFALRQREIASGIIDAVLADLNPISSAKQAQDVDDLEPPLPSPIAPPPEQASLAPISNSSPGQPLAAEHFSFGDDVIASILPDPEASSGTPAGKPLADSPAVGKTEANSWNDNPPIDLALGDAVIDSVLFAGPPPSAAVAESQQAPPLPAPPLPAPSPSPTPRALGRGDLSLDAFLSKLESDPDVAAPAAPETHEPRNGRSAAKNPPPKIPPPKSPPPPTSGAPVPHESPASSEAAPAKVVPIDPRVSQIFAPRSSQPPARPLVPGSPEVKPPEPKPSEVKADPRVSQIFAPRTPRKPTVDQPRVDPDRAEKESTASSPPPIPAFTSSSPEQTESAVSESAHASDLRDSLRPLQLPDPGTPSDAAIQRRVVELAGVGKAKSESNSRPLSSVTIIQIAAVFLTLVLLIAFAFIGSKKPAPPLKPQMPPRPVEQTADSDTAKDAAGSGKAKDSRAVLIKMVRPVYPADAMQAHVYGNVSLQVSIGADGLVHHTRVLSGNPALAKAAVNAVQRWRYTPARRNGIPVAGEETIVVSFDDKQ